MTCELQTLISDLLCVSVDDSNARGLSVKLIDSNFPVPGMLVRPQ